MFEIWGISSSSQEGTCHKESLKLLYAEDWPFDIRLHIHIDNSATHSSLASTSGWSCEIGLPIHIDNNAKLTVLLPQPLFGPLELGFLYT
jgi:hypothetical protein